MSHSRHVCFAAPQTCVLCGTADMYAASHSRQVCWVTTGGRKGAQVGSSRAGGRMKVFGKSYSTLNMYNGSHKLGRKRNRLAKYYQCSTMSPELQKEAGGQDNLQPPTCTKKQIARSPQQNDQHRNVKLYRKLMQTKTT